MDRNQIIGMVLIAAIVVGFYFVTMPSEEELAATKRKQDSVSMVQKARQKEMEEQQILEKRRNDSLAKISKDSIVPDSIHNQELYNKFADFANSSVGKEKFIVLENKAMKVTFSTLGGRIYSVQLKDYKTSDGKPLLLFEGKENIFGLDFYAKNRGISTQNLYFQPSVNDTVIDATHKEQSITFKLAAGENNSIDYVYTIKPDSFLLEYSIKFNNVSEIIDKHTIMDLNWETNMPALERGFSWENQNTTVYYKFHNDEVESLSATSEFSEETLGTKVQWIGYKHQFFSSVLISKNPFPNAYVSETKLKEDTANGILAKMKSKIAMPYANEGNTEIPMTFYFGPNQYKTLNNIVVYNDENLELEKMIPLGWTIFGWVNKYAIIPLFNFLSSFLGSYGLIILIMTIIIKIVIFPMTYKSYQSSAKMRVLKPQVEEAVKKIPQEKAMERQQMTMALYKKAGVNPMGGCIPILLQFPILIAMFNFFPIAIELRQQSFLWATDLSSYDSILTLPFEIPWYGAHVSLFTLLMAASIIVSQLLTGTSDINTSQMPGMKWMLWLMPIMMVFWFNSYSAGLSYYYFLSNLITIGQTMLMRRFVDEDKLLAQLTENVKKNKEPKKSKFQQRLEEMAKKRGIQMPK